MGLQRIHHLHRREREELLQRWLYLRLRLRLRLRLCQWLCLCNWQCLCPRLRMYLCLCPCFRMYLRLCLWLWLLELHLQLWL